MHKIGWLAAAACVTLAVVVSARIDAQPTLAPAVPLSGEAAYRSGLPFDADCSPDIDAAADDGVFGPAWAALVSSLPDARPGFQDAASDAGTPPLPTQDGAARRPPIITALFALGGLLILLRRRPG